MTKSNRPERKTIPKFQDEAEAASFWDANSPLDFPGEFEEADVEFKPRKRGLTVRLDPSVIGELSSIAEQQGVGPTTLVRMWVLERLRRNERRYRIIAGEPDPDCLRVLFTIERPFGEVRPALDRSILGPATRRWVLTHIEDEPGRHLYQISDRTSEFSAVAKLFEDSVRESTRLVIENHEPGASFCRREWGPAFVDLVKSISSELYAEGHLPKGERKELLDDLAQYARV